VINEIFKLSISVVSRDGTPDQNKRRDPRKGGTEEEEKRMRHLLVSIGLTTFN